MDRAGGAAGPGQDPVRSFERWKKKYGKRQARLQLQRKQRKRPEWQQEREGIARLQQRYAQVSGRARGGLGAGSRGGYPALARPGPARRGAETRGSAAPPCGKWAQPGATLPKLFLSPTPLMAPFP